MIYFSLSSFPLNYDIMPADKLYDRNWDRWSMCARSLAPQSTFKTNSGVYHICYKSLVPLPNALQLVIIFKERTN